MIQCCPCGGAGLCCGLMRTDEVLEIEKVAKKEKPELKWSTVIPEQPVACGHSR